jgi:hypothetical protein
MPHLLQQLAARKEAPMIAELLQIVRELLGAKP